MIGLVLVTHGRLADEFRAVLEHVLGPQKQIEAVTIGAEDRFVNRFLLAVGDQLELQVHRAAPQHVGGLRVGGGLAEVAVVDLGRVEIVVANL